MKTIEQVRDQVSLVKFDTAGAQSHFEEQPDGSVIPVDPSEMQAGAQPVPYALLEAVDALLSNEEHATSGGMRSYQVGSQTWELWEDLRKARLALTAKGN